MRCSWVKVCIIVAVAGLAAVGATGARADDWVFYGGSHEGEINRAMLRDWYTLNRLKPVPKDEATAYHYYDQDSVASNAPYPGGIVRVWERFVLQKETKSYDESKEEIQREEEARLKRKISVLDYAWLFLYTVNRATKQIETLYEINCDTKEFFIMEVNYYDRAEKRMSRETNMEMTFWITIRPETMMEALYRRVCEK